jgi:hypothetical protein
MRLRLLTLSSVIFALGCPSKSETPAEPVHAASETAKPAEAAPAAVAAEAAKPVEVVDSGTAAAMPPPGAPTKEPEDNVEVEFLGNFDPGKVKAKRYVIYISKEPCDPIPAEITRLGAMEFVIGNPPNYFLEIFPPQGSTGHICAVGLDESGKIVGVAKAAKNPVAMKGEGEVIFDKMDLTLKPVKARAAPKGL